jgi:glutamyl-tRNA reductase
MFFIDIAVPRDIDPGLNDLDGIFVYNIDDLQQVVASHIGDRRKEAVRAEVLVEEEVRRFEQRAQTAEVVPTIVSLQQHLETLRQAELDRVRGRLGTLSPEQELAVEALTRGIINKIMHTPITTLKASARDTDTESTTVVDVVRKLFNLRAEPGSSEAGPERGVERRSAERRAAPVAGATNPAPAPGVADAPVSPLAVTQSRK